MRYGKASFGWLKGGEKNMYKKIRKAGLIKRPKNKVKEALELILDDRGKLTPEIVVEEATDTNSPLHNRFEWDNGKAGHKYRLMEARLLITSVKVGFVGEKQKGFYNVKTEIGDRVYLPSPTVLSDKAMARQVLVYAAKQLKHWTEEYRNISEFQGVVNEEKLNKILEKE